ncbi:TBC1 domain family member 12 isoform X3 [Triplophysa rosa]|uniref:TBC1 domain family member 12 isoform X3 n=1 Tax=Triplophysa rosa TaxID=992332 RepID=UPI0025461EA4|nr:TBC1 domain family member 12 isoform X3 [Triplophysa rosa]
MGYPSTGVQKSRIISVDSPLKLMVESSSSGSRGAEDSRPPSHIADVTDRREDIMQDMISHTGTSTRDENQSPTGRHTDLLCSAAGSQSCSAPHGTQLPNGNAECEVSKSSHLEGSHLKGEPSCDSLHGALNVDGVLGVESCPSVPLTSQSNSPSEVTEPPQDGGEIRSIGSGHKSNPQKQAHDDEDVSSSPDAEPYRKSSGSPSAAVTRSLRTFSSISLHNNESTSLSPDDGEIFLTSDRPDGLKFMDVSLVSRNTYEISRRQSAPDNIPTTLSVAASGLTLSEKHGVSEMFSSRSLFSRKQRETPSAPGWKLFGKVPLRESPPKDSRTIQQDSNPGNLTSVSTPDLLTSAEYEAKVTKSSPSPSLSSQSQRKNLEFEPMSTTALILEDRPANLPAKSEEEAQRHRQEYDEMVAEMKKRELKDAQKKKKQMKERFKQEDSIANAMLVWNNDILPNWENMRGTRRVRDLWWQGLPPNVRGKVWSLAIGNELNITSDLYDIFLSRARERWRSIRETGCELESDVDSGASVADRESSLDVIKLDISRTFPSLFILQKGGPYHDLLHSVLGAYTCYRPDVGYVQGMSFIAAVLILNLEEADAFIAFANLLNKPCQMAFFRVDHELMLKYFAAFEVFFEENLPRLFNHFKSYNLTPDLYLIDWIFTLYSKSLPLDVACRVWDVFCRDGEEFLFRTGLGILRLYEEVLLQMDFIHIAQFLNRLPEDTHPERLFSCISNTHMLSGNRKWTQVFNILVKDKEAEKTSSPAMKNS